MHILNLPFHLNLQRHKLNSSQSQNHFKLESETGQHSLRFQPLDCLISIVVIWQ